MKGFVAFVALCLTYWVASQESEHEREIRFASTEAPFIINGRDANWAEFPWQVSLELPTYEVDGTDGHFCGGSVIGDRWILTAGHCLIIPTFAYRILGNVITRSVDRLTTGRFYNITVHTRHEGYDPDYENISYVNDIALIQLDDPIEWEPQMVAIRLPEKGHEFPTDGHCVISGWGTDRGPIDLPEDVMKAADTNVITNEECQERVEGIGNVGPGHICVYSGENGACSGDSGGPLACKDHNDPYGNWLLAGVTSWGIVGIENNRTVCSINYPSAYTRVSEYVDWIRNIAEIAGYPIP